MIYIILTYSYVSLLNKGFRNDYFPWASQVLWYKSTHDACNVWAAQPELTRNNVFNNKINNTIKQYKAITPTNVFLKCTRVWHTNNTNSSLFLILKVPNFWIFQQMLHANRTLPNMQTALTTPTIQIKHLVVGTVYLCSVAHMLIINLIVRLMLLLLYVQQCIFPRSNALTVSYVLV